MELRFFKKEEITESKAIYAGVYQFKIGLVRDSEDKYLSLYIGESYSMLIRCSEHLYEVFHNDPSYFGFTQDNINDDSLMLIVDVYKSISLPDDISNSERDNILRNKEIEAIQALHPILQNETNDHVKPNCVEIVQAAIIKLKSNSK